jgi:hypothetical protein
MSIQSRQALIEPIEKEIQGKTFVLSKVPVIQMREVAAMYAIAFVKKLEDYEKNQAAMYKLLSYAGVEAGGSLIMLSNEKLINSHVNSLKMLLELEIMMLDHSIPDFQLGRIWNSLKDTALSFHQKVTETLMALSAQLSMPAKPHSKSSEPSTL